MNDIRVILIGGTSHTGKSTLAAHLARRPGWAHLSTDSLARHPGRPWGGAGARPQVAKYYLELSDRERLQSVLTHYRNMWPLVERLVCEHANERSEQRLVLEGSGLLPENVISVRVQGVAAIWLTGEEALLRSRIYKESAYADLGGREQKMIDAFVRRAADFNRAVAAWVAKLELPFLDVSDSTCIDELARECSGKMRRLA